MAGKCTRQDVALKAGVSGATVSRVYNHPDKVDPLTRDKVKEAASLLGFVPDPHAQALRSRKSGAILLVEISGQSPYDWPDIREYHTLYGNILRGLLHLADPSLERFIPVQLSSPKEIKRLSQELDFDGILGFGIETEACAQALYNLGKPAVLCHHTENLSPYARVSTDNRLGGRLVAEHLGKLGAQKGLFVGKYLDSVGSHQRRREGFFEAWQGRSIASFEGCLGVKEGIEAGKHLAADIKSGNYDALGAVNDLTALGLLQGLREEGLEVGKDFLLCGYDNLPLFQDISGLPTVEAHLPEVYQEALILLRQGLSNKELRFREPAPCIAPSLVPGKLQGS